MSNFNKNNFQDVSMKYGGYFMYQLSRHDIVFIGFLPINKLLLNIFYFSYVLL